MGVQIYAALLRGINLGARNKVSMAELKELFEALGAEGIETYLRSGNVVFTSAMGAQKLRGAIEQSISRELGLDVTVLLRTHSQLDKLVAGNPFARRDPATLHVTFLAGAPDRARVKALGKGGFEPDELSVAGEHVYLHCPNGYGRSKLSNAFFERELDVAATTRNWKTVTALAGLASAAT